MRPTSRQQVAKTRAGKSMLVEGDLSIRLEGKVRSVQCTGLILIWCQGMILDIDLFSGYDRIPGGLSLDILSLLPANICSHRGTTDLLFYSEVKPLKKNSWFHV